MKYFTTMLLAVALLASVIGCKSENFFPEKIILPLQKKQYYFSGTCQNRSGGIYDGNSAAEPIRNGE